MIAGITIGVTAAALIAIAAVCGFTSAARKADRALIWI